MQGIRPRATAGARGGPSPEPPQRPRRSRRSAYIPAAVPLFPDAPFPAAPKPQCLRYPVVPFASLSLSVSPPPFPHAFVPQNQPIWSPEPGKTPIRTPKQAFLGSQAQKNTPPCPKTRHFGVQALETHHCRWAKQALLPIRARKNSSPLGKTGVFAHPRPGRTPTAVPWQCLVAGDRDSRDSHG